MYCYRVTRLVIQVAVLYVGSFSLLEVPKFNVLMGEMFENILYTIRVFEFLFREIDFMSIHLPSPLRLKRSETGFCFNFKDGS